MTNTNAWLDAARRELTRRDRKTGGFIHPAVPEAFFSPGDMLRIHGEDTRPRDQEDEQQAAVREVICISRGAASDRRAATKLAPVTAIREKYQNRSATLEEIAAELIRNAEAKASADPLQAGMMISDAATLRRVAEWCQTQLRWIRGADDPLTIEHDHGDALARGVQITIAAFLRDRFGAHLHGTAANLTAWALDLDNVPSARVSRSAF
ncbi:MAG: hypothetical protein EXR07_16160 [Acetobacteraceae bacterium]|nr:hypothetical protein [Acetobacteraceae bacterium]